MTLRYTTRRIDVALADALRAAAAPVRLWAGARVVLHEGVAAEAVGQGPHRCASVVQQAQGVEVAHEGPGPGPLWLGGLAFDDEHEARGAWRGFGAACFQLPRAQLVWQDGEVFETRLEPSTRPPPPATAPSPVLPPPATAPSPVLAPSPGAVLAAPAPRAAPQDELATPGPAFACVDPPTWRGMIEDARQAIHAGTLTKVVLARVAALEQVRPRDDVLRLLAAGPGRAEASSRADARQAKASSTHGTGAPLPPARATAPSGSREDPAASTHDIAFLFESGDSTFYGRTPETLLRLAGRAVTTHALAGSGDDGALLLASGKDVLEHELVAAFVRERLVEAGVRHVSQGSRGLRKLRHVQHLETPVHGEAPAGAHVLALAAVLHPTPAVCGTPRRRSMQWIRDHEGWPRGWYSGAIGWFDLSGQGELSVALRCALQTPAGRFGFAGAGIVAGSHPEAEWDETEAKLAAVRERDGRVTGGEP